MSAASARAVLAAAACGLVLAAAPGCAPKERRARAAAAPPPESAAPDGPAWDGVFPHGPGAVVIAGAVPLWFEFAPRFPRRVDRVEDAEPAAFTPWPQAPHATGIIPFENGLAVAVNRYGFLAMMPAGPERLLVYAFEETSAFPRYTASAPFYADGSPAVILSAVDVFLNERLSPPEARAFTLAAGETAPRETSIAAFERYPPRDGWNIDGLFPSGEGLWYFKARAETAGRPPRAVYARTASSGASDKVEEISAAAYYGAARPASAAALPSRVARLVERAGLADADWTLSLFSAGSGGGLRYARGAALTDGEAAAPELRAFYAGRGEAGEPADERAVLLVPADGRGGAASLFFYDENGLESRLSLPPLPGTFVWTAAGVAGGTFIIAWEEREQWNIGAAGFCALSRPHPPR